MKDPKDYFTFEKRMEDMTDKDVTKRIKDAFNWEMPKLRPIPYIGERDQKVEYVTEELMAVCPVTGYPDLYKLKIEFVPDKTLPELKSLKFYYMGFHDLPISHEHIVAKIYKEFKKQIKPKQLHLVLDVAARGGVVTRVEMGKII